MGFFKKLFKGVKKIFKGIGKAFKGIVKGVKKVFKSKLGKFLLLAAAVYFGGGMMGMWNTPFTSAGATAGGSVASNVAGQAAQQAGLGSAAGGASGATASGMSTATGMTGAASQGAMSAAMTSGAPSIVSPSAVGALAGEAVASPMISAAGAAGTAGASGGLSGGLIGGLKAAGGKVLGGLGKAAGWAQANPFPAMMAGNMISGMMTPSEAEQQIELEKWRRANSTIAGVKYDGSGPGIQFGGLGQMVQQHDPYDPYAGRSGLLTQYLQPNPYLNR